MPRLYRPHIPVRVECLVLARQLGWNDPEHLVQLHHRGLSKLRARMAGELAGRLGCDMTELRLDHNPPLGARERRGEGKQTVYTPPANDPTHLEYRPQGPQHAGSHLIKTNVRGDNGQHPDRVLIKKARRLERGNRKKPTRKIGSRNFTFSTNKLRPKKKWPKQKFPKRK